MQNYHQKWNLKFSCVPITLSDDVQEYHLTNSFSLTQVLGLTTHNCHTVTLSLF